MSTLGKSKIESLVVGNLYENCLAGRLCEGGGGASGLTTKCLHVSECFFALYCNMADMPAAGQHKTWNVQVARSLVSSVTFMTALGLGNTIQAARDVYPQCLNSTVQRQSGRRHETGLMPLGTLSRAREVIIAVEIQISP